MSAMSFITTLQQKLDSVLGHLTALIALFHPGFAEPGWVQGLVPSLVVGGIHVVPALERLLRRTPSTSVSVSTMPPAAAKG